MSHDDMFLGWVRRLAGSQVQILSFGPILGIWQILGLARYLAALLVSGSFFVSSICLVWWFPGFWQGFPWRACLKAIGFKVYGLG